MSAEASPIPSADTSCRRDRWGLDPAGTVASVVCGIHCLASPALMWVSTDLVGEGIEHALCAVAAFLALATAARRWRTPSGTRVAAWVALGLGLLALRFTVAEEGSVYERGLCVLSSVAFIAAHWISRKQVCASCE